MFLPNLGKKEKTNNILVDLFGVEYILFVSNIKNKVKEKRGEIKNNLFFWWIYTLERNIVRRWIK